MDRATIARAIEDALPVAREIFRKNDLCEAEGRFPEWPPQFREVSDRVAALLLAQPEFSNLAERYVDFGGVKLPLYPPYFSSQLLRIGVECGSHGAVDWVEKLLSTTTAEVLCVRLIRGIKIDEAVSFGDGDIELVSFDDLPDSDHKSAEQAKALSWFGGPTPRELPARAALVAIFRIENFLTTIGARSAPMECLSKLERVASALAVAVGRPVLAGEGWAEYVDPDLEAVRTGRGTHSSREDVRPEHLFDHPVNAHNAKEFIDAYLALPPSMIDVVNIAAQRLNQAMRRSLDVDQVLDAAIGIEALLGDGNDRSEISDRLARRAALVIGGDLEQRKAAKRQIKKLYALRSRAVHTGRTDENARESVTSCLELGLEIVRKIVALGRVPPWDEWELMGRPNF